MAIGPPCCSGALHAAWEPDREDNACCRYALEIATDEINHVADLRALLGNSSQPCPLMNIGTAFATLAEAALGTQKAKDVPYSPYENDINFILGARPYDQLCFYSFTHFLLLSRKAHPSASF